MINIVFADDMAGDPLKTLSQLKGGFKGGRAIPLATTAGTTSASGADNGKEKRKEWATYTRRKKNEGEADQDPKCGRNDDLPSPLPKYQKVAGGSSEREGRGSDLGVSEHQSGGLSDEITIREVNIFYEMLDVNHTDLDQVFLSEKTLNHINGKDLDDLVQAGIHNHFKGVSLLKYLDQYYIPSLQKRADLGEKNKQQLKDLSEKHAELEGRLKNAEATAEVTLKDKKAAGDRAKAAEESLAGMKGQIKDLQDEVDGLKDSIKKAKDLTEEEVRRTEERITQEWKTEQETLVQTFSGLADAVEKTIFQQV